MATRRSKNRKQRTDARATAAKRTERGTKQAAVSGFQPKVLDRTVIAIPLLDEIEAERKRGRARKVRAIVIDLNLEYRGGLKGAHEVVKEMVGEIVQVLLKNPAEQHVNHKGIDHTQYVFASIDGDVIRKLVRRDAGAREEPKPPPERAIYHVWPDFPIKRLTNKSVATVKADAAHASFAAFGANIVWAVIDSGIDSSHPHFRSYANLTLRAPLEHRDFTGREGDASTDAFGHGTHVAGIIAGAMTKPEDGTIKATTQQRDEHDEPVPVPENVAAITGMAPRCKLLSLKVMDDDGGSDGAGASSSIITALQYVQQLNGYGRRLLVHGVNLSVGYDFKPEWFACGQSPLCVEVNRLVKSGVVVVVAAGNSGYGDVQTRYQGVEPAGLAMTINDPGNADLAITVGSTHRDMPYMYGVSYFSSKGPTGDGRMKPDVLAPGEKIISCDSNDRLRIAAGQRPQKKAGKFLEVGHYREDSGTSMAAPHVSGVIAAFLSIRREFIGRPEDVKRIFLSSATDLGRAPYFQGRGLVDLMRAIQSV
jgi:subtilisin family serine protease